jgi:hypothetical protein
MKLPAVPSEGLLQALPPEERKRLGRAGMTKAEAEAKYAAGREKDLQDDIATWLNGQQIYFDWDRMDTRTSGRRGRADFRVCVPVRIKDQIEGRWLSVEAKTQSGTLTSEQAEQAARLRKSGGKFIVARSLAEVIEAVRELQRPFYRYE